MAYDDSPYSSDFLNVATIMLIILVFLVIVSGAVAFGL
jgi:hypothetical protein